MKAAPTITFKNSPSLIDSISIPGMAGLIGITACPGMQDDFSGARSSEALSEDLQAIRAWGATVVVTLLEESEINALGVWDLGKHVVALGMVWLHLPARRIGVPDEFSCKKWRISVPCLCNLLRQGQRVVIHCREGAGRAGMFATHLLMALGTPVAEAISLVRHARAGSLPLPAHEKYCYNLDIPSCRVPAGILSKLSYILEDN